MNLDTLGKDVSLSSYIYWKIHYTGQKLHLWADWIRPSTKLTVLFICYQTVSDIDMTHNVWWNKTRQMTANFKRIFFFVKMKYIWLTLSYLFSKWCLWAWISRIFHTSFFMWQTSPGFLNYVVLKFDRVKSESMQKQITQPPTE